MPIDLEGQEDEAGEAAVFAEVQGAGGCAPFGAWGNAGERCGWSRGDADAAEDPAA